MYYFFLQGVGIPAHLQDSVCHTYVRDNEMAERLKVPGTGLGLSIASNLVRKMGGKLTFHSVVGLGTDFYVSHRHFFWQLLLCVCFFFHFCSCVLSNG